jgi:hypothetical protein
VENIYLNLTKTFYWTFLLFLSTFEKLAAQDSLPKQYVGYRLQLVDFEQVKRNGNVIKVKCTVVNTGRFAIKLAGKVLPKIPLTTDADLNSLKTLNLDDQAEQICQQLRLQKINLEPGAMIPRFMIQFTWKAKPKSELPVYQKPTTSVEVDSIKISTAPATIESEEESTNEQQCSDLAIEDIKVLSINKKQLELTFTVVNKGVSDALIFGTKRGKDDNVAVQFYLSSSPRLTRGSINLEAVFLTQGLESTNGKLPAGGRCIQKIKINIERANRFNKVLILYMDNFDVIRECDETNNEASITPNWLFK